MAGTADDLELPLQPRIRLSDRHLADDEEGITSRAAEALGLVFAFLGLDRPPRLESLEQPHETSPEELSRTSSPEDVPNRESSKARSATVRESLLVRGGDSRAGVTWPSVRGIETETPCFPISLTLGGRGCPWTLCSPVGERAAPSHPAECPTGIEAYALRHPLSARVWVLKE